MGHEHHARQRLECGADRDEAVSADRHLDSDTGLHADRLHRLTDHLLSAEKGDP
ncbi:hypothetical protein D3C81_2294280 [compost metagenome]